MFGEFQKSLHTFYFQDVKALLFFSSLFSAKYKLTLSKTSYLNNFEIMSLSLKAPPVLRLQ